MKMSSGSVSAQRSRSDLRSWLCGRAGRGKADPPGRKGNTIFMNIMRYLGRGIHHERKDLPCQDVILDRRAENGNQILVLSDGASSAAYAQQAAVENCRGLCACFEQHPLEDFLALEETVQKQTIIDACACALLEFLAGLELPEQVHLGELSATLLFVVMDERHILTGHLGDGGIFCVDNGAVVYASAPDNRNGVSNRTYFTVSQDAVSHLRLHTLDRTQTPVRNILLTSDGAYHALEEYYGDTEKTVLEMIEMVINGEVADAAGLRSVLSEIALAPIQRMDDWSMLLVDMQQPVPPQEPLEPMSMLREEEAKYPGVRKKPYRYRVRDCRAREMTWTAFYKAHRGLEDAGIETMALELSRQIEQEHLHGSSCVDVRPEHVCVTVRHADADGGCDYTFSLRNERRKKAAQTAERAWDAYALSALLYQAAGEAEAFAAAELFPPIPRSSGLPRTFWQAVRRAGCKDPARRLTVEELRLFLFAQELGD